MRVGGNTPCIELRLGDRIFIFDAGTGIIPFGAHLMRQQSVRELNIILTHYHWDHISGLPFFIPAFVPGWHINFFGPAESPDELEYHIAQQMKAPYFPVETETWLADINYFTPQEKPIEIDPITVRSFTVFHPGTTYGYRIEVGGKTIVYAPDNELWFLHQSIEARKEEFDEDERALLEQMKEEQRWRGIEFMENVDILIHDSQYTTADYQKKRGWGHSCYIDTVNSAMEAGARSLFLYSHDPSYDDDELDRMLRKSLDLVNERGSPMNCDLAREGEIVELDLDLDLD
jgi:phosphoribosyl 1,2-cyclic phosphodiesterase